MAVQAGPGAPTASSQSRAGQAREAAPAVENQLVWASSYASILVVVDCVAIFLGLVAAYFARFAGAATPDAAPGLSYAVILVLTGPLWLTLLVIHRCYDARMFGFGPSEYRRIVLATFRLFGGAAIVCFLAKLSLSREFLAIAAVVGLALLLVGRYGARRWLHRKRRDGLWCRRVVAVGQPVYVDELARVLAREPLAGYAVVGGCFPGVEEDVTPGGVASLGPITGVVNAARAAHCDTIAVTASPGITSATLRRLAWDLEGTGIALVVAPALTDVAGPRISIQPVAGLPLLHVDEPELGTLHRTVKRVMDVTMVSVGLLLLAPVFALIGAMIKTTSRGPVIFRQTRVGRDGEEFLVHKFRTMHVDAESRLTELKRHNDASGPLFKMRSDPRVTTVGRWLRRFSLDELPQLWNVLKGEMSVVGPRPPLPREVEHYEDETRRRLLVKPGVTGLWQVSGRSDLSWDDSVRLDLYYVENWSPLLDLVILVRTLVAVVRGTGAY